MPAAAKDKNITRQIPVDDSFVESVIGYPSTIAVTWVTLIRGPDYYEFCGAITYKLSQAKKIMRSSLNNSRITEGGETVLKGFSFYNTLGTGSKGIGEMANCKATTVPSSKRNPDFDFEFASRKGRI